MCPAWNDLAHCFQSIGYVDEASVDESTENLGLIGLGSSKPARKSTGQLVEMNATLNAWRSFTAVMSVARSGLGIRLLETQDRIFGAHATVFRQRLFHDAGQKTQTVFQSASASHRGP